MVMKRIFLYIIATGFLLAGCAEREKVESVTASIVIDESGLDPEVVRPVSYEVTLTNNLSNLSSTVNSSDGRASVPGLVPGLYSVNVKAQTKNGAFVYMLSGSTRSASFISDGDSYEIHHYYSRRYISTAVQDGISETSSTKSTITGQRRSTWMEFASQRQSTRTGITLSYTNGIFLMQGNMSS